MRVWVFGCFGGVFAGWCVWALIGLGFFWGFGFGLTLGFVFEFDRVVVVDVVSSSCGFSLGVWVLIGLCLRSLCMLLLLGLGCILGFLVFDVVVAWFV